MNFIDVNSGKGVRSSAGSGSFNLGNFTVTLGSSAFQASMNRSGTFYVSTGSATVVDLTTIAYTAGTMYAFTNGFIYAFIPS